VRLAFFYFKLFFLSTIRNIPALFFTLIFPPLMLLLFAHQWENKNSLGAVIIFFNYSVQTVALMLLGMGVTQEKNSDWAKYLRTLPVGIMPMLLGRLLHTLMLSLINLVTLSFVALFILKLPLAANNIFYFSFIALIGGIPMALLGMIIGYAANPESSRSIFTLLNLLLLFGSFALPGSGFFGMIRNFIPTYQWSLLSFAQIDQGINPSIPLLWLCGYTLLFILIFQKVYHKSLKNY
jgi:ABC-2 type transport system permease protein